MWSDLSSAKNSRWALERRDCTSLYGESYYAALRQNLVRRTPFEEDARFALLPIGRVVG